MKEMTVEHDFAPIFDENSRILILGTMPSVKSREQGFYYGHKQNRFWKVLANVTGDTLPQTIEEKKAFLLRNKIAIWDVIKKCDIIGSSDASIKNAEANDIAQLVESTNITKIYANGKAAKKLYDSLVKCDMEAILLPSTSPANAAFSLEKLTEKWSVILEEL
ncbi:MAG: DNA-deoxyinosine glycosylase [Clostridia bacterium]|nr:DNA-deoxyinosine glycosylase [Clostridia bacterium]